MFERFQSGNVDKWYREASKGKARFILFRGVVCWGLPMFMIMTFLFPVIAGSPDEPYCVTCIVRSSVSWGLGGVLFGWLLWFFGVKKYGLTRKTGDNTVIDER